MTESRIGPYSIVRLIKQGGQGQVYLGYDRRLQRKVAIKIGTLPRGWVARRRALSEARKAARMNSPHVVQIYDLIESGGHLAIVMEYVPGTDLEAVLAQRRLSLASILAVAADLSVALAASRQQRVVHGDLKAANVLITRAGRVKLTDFGVARTCEVDEGSSGGSLSALTPEHITGAALDLRSDLFALGALLYRMLTGEHAFYRGGELQAADMTGSAELLLRGKIAPTQDVPEELLSMVESLLQADPADRPQNTHPVRSGLRALQRSLPLSLGQSLQREASPYFRPESPEDIPPGIPSQLRERGRSQLEYSIGSRLLRFLRGLRLSSRIALAAVVAAAIAIPLMLLMQEHPVRVHFDPPEVQMADREGIPRGVDSEWLMDSVYTALEGEMGPLQVSGAVSPRAYHAGLAGHDPEYLIRTGLRCSEMLCVFSISRQGADGFDYRQAVIAHGLPEEVWTGLVVENSRALFRGNWF